MKSLKFLSSAALLAFSFGNLASADDGKVIVRMDASVAGYVAAQHGLTIEKKLDAAGSMYLLRAANGPVSPATLGALKANPLVQAAGPNATVNLPNLPVARKGLVALNASTPTALVAGSPLYTGQYAVGKIQLPDAQKRFSGAAGSATKVALIDTWVDIRHVVLKDVIDKKNAYDCITGKNFQAVVAQETTPFIDQETTPFIDAAGSVVVNQETTPFIDQETTPFIDQETTPFIDNMPVAYGHGTMVAGLIHLVAPGATILPIRAFTTSGTGTIADIVEGLYYARGQGVNVINMSFSVPATATAGELEPLNAAIADVCTGNTVCVASVANGGSSENLNPAGYLDKVIGIAASDQADMLAVFSDYGTSVDLAAPGVDIWSAYPGDHYARNSGTSFASPIVAGTAALMRAYSGAMTVGQATQGLTTNACALKAGGFVRLNVFGAVTGGKPSCK